MLREELHSLAEVVKLSKCSLHGCEGKTIPESHNYLADLRGKGPPSLEQSKSLPRLPDQGPLIWPTHQRHPMLKLAKK
jgi:hypothetical protein